MDQYINIRGELHKKCSEAAVTPLDTSIKQIMHNKIGLTKVAFSFTNVMYVYIIYRLYRQLHMAATACILETSILELTSQITQNLNACMPPRR